MQDKLYGWKYTGHVLAIFYVWAAFCLPWAQASYSYYRAVNEQHSNNTEEPAHSVLTLTERMPSPEEAKRTEQRVKQCAASFICRVVNFRILRIADVSTDDPVAFFTIVLAASTIGLWFQTWKLAAGAEAQSVHFEKSVAAATNLRKQSIANPAQWSKLKDL